MNNTQVNSANNVDVVIPIYNLSHQSDNYSKTAGSLWKFRRDEPAPLMLLILCNNNTTD